jgi:REP element-mobilizing transposase RayT
MMSGLNPGVIDFLSIYHVMARGNARQKIVRDDADRRRLIDGLEQTVVRHDWELLCYVVMGNHLHLLWAGGFVASASW